MKIDLPNGKYVIAVSGGVDSMVLLELLANKPDIELVVAHFNHNIRSDSNEDEKLVSKTAKKYGLAFESGHANLSKAASEAIARKARYDFLRSVQKKHNAQAIITAHHQDDKIETALINILRGTGRQGLAAISLNPNVIRPLLDTPKHRVISYATKHKLNWREDTTNTDGKYLRNYLRLNVLPILSSDERQQIISNIDKVAENSKYINTKITTLSQLINRNNRIDRGLFTNLPTDLSNELVIYWLKEWGVRDYDKKNIDRLSMALKTSKINSVHPVNDNIYLKLQEKSAQITNTL